jgi:hypothetical protein
MNKIIPALLAASAVSITGESMRYDHPIRQWHLDKAAQQRKLKNRRRNKLAAISRRRNRKP